MTNSTIRLVATTTTMISSIAVEFVVAREFWASVSAVLCRIDWILVNSAHLGLLTLESPNEAHLWQLKLNLHRLGYP